MTKKRKTDWRVVFWHNDFPDGLRKHNVYGKEGPLYQRVLKNIAPGADLNWRFHGGFISPERSKLLERLGKADVLISVYPWNMDHNNNQMHWHEAESNFITLMTAIKRENPKLKIFFLVEPHHWTKEFQKIGELVNDMHDEVIYDYFRRR